MIKSSSDSLNNFYESLSRLHKCRMNKDGQERRYSVVWPNTDNLATVTFLLIKLFASYFPSTTEVKRIFSFLISREKKDGGCKKAQGFSFTFLS